MRFHEFPQSFSLFVLFKSNVLGDRQKIFLKICYQFLKYARTYLCNGRHAPVNAMTNLAMNVK